MTSQEAVERVAFWTTNVAETQAWGSSTDPELGAFFHATVSIPREPWTNPGGPQHYDIRVARWLRGPDETEPHENALYVLVAEEIERRKAGGEPVPAKPRATQTTEIPY